MKSVFVSMLLMLLSTGAIFAQYESGLSFGVRAGATYSGISNLPKLIVPESFYANYTFDEKDVWGMTAGVFINFKFPGSRFGIQPEVNYASNLGSRLVYDDVNDYHYTMDLKYSYIQIGIPFKAYPWRGLYAAAAPMAGFNITPGKLEFHSNTTQYGPDIEMQQQMSNVIKGRTDFSIGLGLGYEFSFGLSIDAYYYFGLSDVVETQVNGFNFIENTNKSRAIRVTLGWAFPFHGWDFRR